MTKIVRRAILVGLLSLILSLLISFSLVPLLGGSVDGNGLLMAIICPLAISIPASALHFTQLEKLRKEREISVRAHRELANVHQLLRRQARTDPLTGLLNRQAFLDDLSSRTGTGISGALFYVDLDHFKAINDSFGHAVGDRVIEATGVALQKLTSDDDLVARFGGEEFVIFKPNATTSEIEAIAENIRAKVKQIKLACHELKRPLSASIGAAVCEAPFNIETSLNEADMRLYEAKRLGRDRAVLSGTFAPHIPLAI